jgi:hypothetical protein
VEAGGLAVSSGDVCMIGAVVVGSICRHGWKLSVMAAMTVLSTMVEDCECSLRWVVSLAVSDEAADELY